MESKQGKSEPFFPLLGSQPVFILLPAAIFLRPAGVVPSVTSLDWNAVEDGKTLPCHGTGSVNVTLIAS